MTGFGLDRRDIENGYYADVFDYMFYAKGA